MKLAAGATIGSYEVVSLLGSGGLPPFADERVTANFGKARPPSPRNGFSETSSKLGGTPAEPRWAEAQRESPDRDR
jgi:hypothetical protein